MRRVNELYSNKYRMKIIDTIKLKRYLLKWVWIIFALIVLVFVISWLFPKQIPFIDTVRVNIQQTFLSSISAIRYPNVSANDGLTAKYIRKNIQSVLRPWDILFSHRAWFITNDLIDGKRKHASIFLWNKSTLQKFIKNNGIVLSWDIINMNQRKKTDMLIIDSTEHGVTVRSIDDLTYLDDILIVRIEKSQTQKEKMITTLLEQLGKPYNYDFDINDTSSIYCSQLILQGLTTIDITIPYTSFAWRAYLYPQDIVDYIIATWIQNKEFSIVTAIKNIQTDPQFYTEEDILNIYLLQIDQ
jgi:Permuted papain-like amidase enzyme, YaeF/YiiX, C92 family